jgi:2-dehydro-3-deoxyphosphogluconate aldolase / (4S)-4-hydroxy-2-oxoglutarate aldolase
MDSRIDVSARTTGRAATVEKIEQLGVVAVIRTTDGGKLRAIVDALAGGGIRALEVTMTVPRAVDLIREIARTLPDGFLLGAGTVTNAETARQVIDAGAAFVVGPILRTDVIRACHARDVTAIPGCLSPTEMFAAHECGVDVVKVFPATSLGPQFIKDIRGPLPFLKMMPTGGVTIDNAADWLRAGAVAVGIGSALVDAAAVERGEFAAITANAERLVANVARARAPRS